MQTILDFTKEIVDEIRRYKDEFTLTFTPDAIQIVSYYGNDIDWTIIESITLSNGFFNVSIDYGFETIDEQFETVKETVDFIFK